MINDNNDPIIFNELFSKKNKRMHYTLASTHALNSKMQIDFAKLFIKHVRHDGTVIVKVLASNVKQAGKIAGKIHDQTFKIVVKTQDNQSVRYSVVERDEKEGTVKLQLKF